LNLSENQYRMNLSKSCHRFSALKILIVVLMMPGLQFCRNAPDENVNTDEYSRKIGGNPVISEGSADPSVRVFGGRVYVYPSHDYSSDNEFWIMKDWKVYSTEDLVNFRDHGVALKGTDIAWAKEPDHCWAPDCVEHNGRYYFFFPMSDVRGVWKGEIGVAVGDSPSGPFGEVHGQPLVASDDKPPGYEGPFYNIDPGCFIDDDGTPYLFWGNGACFAARLSEDMKSFDSEIRKVEITGHQGYAEGPFVWKRGDRYYILYSRVGGRSFDMLDYGISDHPLGPYRYGGTIVAHGRKGNIHGSVFEFKGQWYVAYHDLFPTDKYRKTCIERIHYNDDGTIVQAPATRSGVGWYNASEIIQAEDYFSKSTRAAYLESEDTGFYMHQLADGDWLHYPNVVLPVYFSRKISLRKRSAKGSGTLRFHLDSLNGTEIARIDIAENPDHSEWEVMETTCADFEGIHDLWILVSGKKGWRVDLDGFRIH